MFSCMERVINARFGLIGHFDIYTNRHSLYKHVIIMSVMKVDYRSANMLNTAGVQLFIGRDPVTNHIKWRQKNYCYEPSVEFKRDWSLEYYFTVAFERWWDSVICVLQGKARAMNFANAIRAELLQKVMSLQANEMVEIS